MSNWSENAICKHSDTKANGIWILNSFSLEWLTPLHEKDDETILVTLLWCYISRASRQYPAEVGRYRKQGKEVFSLPWQEVHPAAVESLDDTTTDHPDSWVPVSVIYQIFLSEYLAYNKQENLRIIRLTCFHCQYFFTWCGFGINIKEYNYYWKFGNSQKNNIKDK